MIKKHGKTILGVNLLILLLVLSPFLPGPSILSVYTNTIFNLTQLGGLLGLPLIPICLIWIYIQAIKKREQKVLPILLCTIPAVMFIVSIWGAGLAREISRKIAIGNAEKLIIAIESFKVRNKNYPNDLSELLPNYINKIPSPGIMGIAEYLYERQTNNYSLSFSQNVIIGFNFEVVVYDPTEKYNPDGESTTLYDTGKEKWKYYIYD